MDEFESCKVSMQARLTASKRVGSPIQGRLRKWGYLQAINRFGQSQRQNGE
jgi:hypothetical protein